MAEILCQHGLGRSVNEVEVIVRRDPELLTANLYVTNPTSTDLTWKWTQLLQRHHGNEGMVGGEFNRELGSGFRALR